MDVETRARQSLGSSSEPIYRTVQHIISERVERDVQVKLLDVGCGSGNLCRFLVNVIGEYEGVDVVQYDGFPQQGRFHKLDLDSGRANLPDGYAEIVVAVETIEHLENPRAFMRELVRLCRPGGLVIVTTPNQLSFLSKLTLVVKNQFNAFTDTNYPAHISALLEMDLKRIANECGLLSINIHYTCSGRMPGTSLKFPAWFSRCFPRGLSDNVILTARKP